MDIKVLVEMYAREFNKPVKTARSTVRSALYNLSRRNMVIIHRGAVCLPEKIPAELSHIKTITVIENLSRRITNTLYTLLHEFTADVIRALAERNAEFKRALLDMLLDAKLALLRGETEEAYRRLSEAVLLLTT
jgi:hypothetical protein